MPLILFNVVFYFQLVHILWSKTRSTFFQVANCDMIFNMLGAYGDVVCVKVRYGTVNIPILRILHICEKVILFLSILFSLCSHFFSTTKKYTSFPLVYIYIIINIIIKFPLLRSYGTSVTAPWCRWPSPTTRRRCATTSTPPRSAAINSASLTAGPQRITYCLFKEMNSIFFTIQGSLKKLHF